MQGKIERLTYLLYFLANFLMLINPGVYWDDWLLHNMNDRGILNQFYGNGVIPVGYMHIFLKNLWASPILYRFLTVLLELITLNALFRIINHTSINKEKSIFFALTVLVYAVFPFYDAKITMIVLPYTLCFTLFVLGSLFLIKYRKEKRLFFRILSLLFFFISFFTNSLLFFYLLPVFFILFYDYWKILIERKFKRTGELIPLVGKRIFKYFDFFIIPFLFWIMRSLYFMPSMQYATISYNELSINSLLAIPYRIVKGAYVFAISLLPLLIDAIQNPEFLILILAISSGFIYWFSRNRLDFKISKNLLFWGLFVLFIGSFPYLLVNKFPSYIAYSTRHQLLQGFGFSLVFTGLVFLLPNINVRRIVIAISLSIFISFNIFIQFSYFKGFIKQQVLQDFFAEKIERRNFSKTFIYEDKTASFTLKGNPVAFYALNGILKKSDPVENTMIIRARDLEKLQSTGLYSKIEPYLFQYNLSNYKFSEPEYIIHTNFSEKALPNFQMVSFYGDYILGKGKKWNKYFSITIEPLAN